MENHNSLDKHTRMLQQLSRLPNKMLRLHGIDNLTEFVLHELCHEHCFNFSKAAFFVDNPDFNCMKGIAGFSREEMGSFSQSIWDHPETFSNHMKSSSFNKKVRNLNTCSMKIQNDDRASLAYKFAEDLDFDNHAFCSWTLKHDNHGFLLYESAAPTHNHLNEHLIDGMSILGFCPIF